MEWLLAPATPAAASALRTELTAFLRRHAQERDEVEDAGLVVSELVGNAVEHAGGPVWVGLDWSAARPALVVHDLGPSFDLAELPPPEFGSVRGRGLWLVRQLAAELEVVAKRGTGKRVRTVLPVTRRVEPTYDPPRREVNALPAPDEAGPGGFGRESFLRALVVELARTAENRQGPAVAEEMVAQVGATVGGQMEDEYRRARELTGRLTAEQLADSYLRLKSALDGGFYVISVDTDRVVLGNRRCPFGETVRRAPALCRMTSSVFGGIAARNHGEAVVLLDERIAVGDPECRVTVLLGEAARNSPGGHHYRQDS
ncbi:ATP-binding protein [Micromonospora coxensis]|uniref:Anti-sigma regulatory factor (Ser/Thr protein kinase) n=1 Tax=Micromonospora coxensis TaxID=356852 RepID=A0A1C5H8T7_9ACTN|nr:ATP-binding protein [Micromonospora coxensis]SCG42429.1 Anti-sigma regulatory factor (Ser/Thr protein kinase) [Micromonospora coxensis]